MSAWICGCGFPIEDWAKGRGDVLQRGIQVVGAGRLEHHWIPFQLVPCGVHANVFTWDAPCNGHERFNQVLELVGTALGFQSVLITRQQRFQFPTNVELWPFIFSMEFYMARCCRLLHLKLTWFTPCFARNSLLICSKLALHKDLGFGAEVMLRRKRASLVHQPPQGNVGYSLECPPELPVVELLLNQSQGSKEPR